MFKKKLFNSRIYEKVDLPPVLPAREKGRFYTEEELAKMRKNMDEISDYVNGKNKFLKKQNVQEKVGSIKDKLQCSR